MCGKGATARLNSTPSSPTRRPGGETQAHVATRQRVEREGDVAPGPIGLVPAGLEAILVERDRVVADQCLHGQRHRN